MSTKLTDRDIRNVYISTNSTEKCAMIDQLFVDNPEGFIALAKSAGIEFPTRINKETVATRLLWQNEDNQVAAIREFRNQFGTTLKEAKEYVDAARERRNPTKPDSGA